LPSVEDIVLAFRVMNQSSDPLEVSGCGPGQRSTGAAQWSIIPSSRRFDTDAVA
jgi:hypothetical protein